jgi:hypothetical protein
MAYKEFRNLEIFIIRILLNLEFSYRVSTSEEAFQVF